MTEAPDNTIITVDLDSTLADTTHRHGLIDRVNGTDWHAYSRECINDLPIEGMAVLIRTLVAAGVEVHALSGRKHSAYNQTMLWLDKHDIPITYVWLDETDEGDYVPGVRTHMDYKLERVLEVQEKTGKKVILHIDDWASVAKTFEKNGIPCICVRTPDEMETLTAGPDNAWAPVLK